MTVAYLAQSPARQCAVLQTVWFACSDAATSRTVSVSGEVDAANAKYFATTVCDLAAGADRLTVDLTGLSFIAIDGCAALHSINLQMMRSGTEWQVLQSAAVRRLLDLCDRERLIPTAAVPLTLVGGSAVKAKRTA